MCKDLVHEPWGKRFDGVGVVFHDLCETTFFTQRPESLLDLEFCPFVCTLAVERATGVLVASGHPLDLFYPCGRD